METIGVGQGMGKMHSDVMDTIFNSWDAWDSAIKLCAEVSKFLV